MKARAFAPFVVLVIALFSARSASGAKSYSYFRIGNANDITTTTTAGTVLMGGGTDVDAAFQWMCQRSGGGDFLVIRATGTDAYNPYIQQLCPAENSVATLIIPDRAAARPVRRQHHTERRSFVYRGRRPSGLHQFLERHTR